MQATKGPISIFDPKSLEKKDCIQEEFTSFGEEHAEKSMSCDNELKLGNSFEPVVWPSVGFGF